MNVGLREGAFGLPAVVGEVPHLNVVWRKGEWSCGCGRYGSFFVTKWTRTLPLPHRFDRGRAEWQNREAMVLRGTGIFLLACSSREGEWDLLAVAPFSGSAPRLTNVGMELPTGGATCLGVTSSCVGECGLLAGAPLTGSSRPLGSSLGLLAALGCTSAMELLLAGGGESGFALTAESSESEGDKTR
ncbi:hypothetical protein EYF80_024337 [Liparis tanakae]|uniref:Uncharacterized protein n=1 Tax=Liparis tanakae TaxID=230148 RepID=A0A4Z2HHT7_9TELE|nr:hypothetical protein EYF80_024337 [Liparis tanakae]